jgi:hypothetical protein
MIEHLGNTQIYITKHSYPVRSKHTLLDFFSFEKFLFTVTPEEDTMSKALE